VTKLNKPVYRVTYDLVRDRGKSRALVAGLLPGDMIEVRMQGTQQRASVPIVDVWYYAMRKKAQQTLRERTAARKAKRDSNKLDQLNGG
jgi:hypothetical protein